MAKPNMKNKGHPPPEGRVRRSQAITAYGPGAMVDLVDHSVIVGGLHHWSYPPGEVEVVSEPRLRDSVVWKLKKIDPHSQLSFEAPFRLPPGGDDSKFTRQSGVRVFEFPHWFVCQNPSCRALVGKTLLEYSDTQRRYTHRCVKGTGVATPVRFVMACKRGHLQDVSWNYFVHRGDPCSGASLRLREGRSRDFSEIKVECVTCKSVRMLADLYTMGKGGPNCRGEQPWLGRGEHEPDCQESLSLIVRTASNAYFAQVVSALSIPEAGNQVRDAVMSVWDKVKIATPQTLAVLRQFEEVAAALGTYSDEQVLEGVAAIKENAHTEREPIRTAEFKRMLSEPTEQPSDLPAPQGKQFFAREFTPDGGLPDAVERLVRVHRLREVRVQVGFTRLEAPTADLQGEYDLGVLCAPLVKGAQWLPAAEIHGEGLFLQLSPNAVAAWEKRRAVRKREDALKAGYARWASGKEVPEFPGVRFYMLHSLSHLLMAALAVECGYSASSLAERIYCGAPGTGDDMAGILIKTGTPGAEGTLGGLVEEGRRLREHLRRAWDMGALCSHDPVCAQHEPTDAEERHLDGAACHGCLYIAESSCERFNRYLDRALVVPAMGTGTDLAFLPERP